MALSKSARSSAAKRAWITIRAKFGPSGPPRHAKLEVKPRPKKDMPKQEPIKMPKPRPATAGEMSKRALVFIFTCSCIGNRRKVDTSEIKIDADKAWIGVSKKLIDAPELQAITSLISDARNYVANMALPATTIKKGVYLMSKDLLEEVDAKLVDYDKQLVVLVENLLVVYSALMNEAKERLKGLFNREDYPTPEYLKSAFRLKWQCIKLNPPDRDQMKQKMWERECAKTERMWMEMREAAQQTLRTNLADLVKHLADKLTPEKDGKKKMFKEASITKLNEFLGTFDARNITNDVQLKVLVDKAKSLLKDTDAGVLRTDEATREYVAYGFETIKQALAPMIVNKPSRTIILEEE